MHSSAIVKVRAPIREVVRMSYYVRINGTCKTCSTRREIIDAREGELENQRRPSLKKSTNSPLEYRATRAVDRARDTHHRAAKN